MGRSSRTDNCCGICSAVFECVRFNECTQPYTMWQHEEMYKATFTLWYVYRDVILGVEGPDPWKYVWGSEYVWPPIKCHILSFKIVVGQLGKFQIMDERLMSIFFDPDLHILRQIYTPWVYILYACIRISVRSAEIDPTVLLIMPYGKTNH